MADAIYKTVKTPEAYYVYDRSINTIVAVTEADFNELNSLSFDERIGDTPIIQRLQQRGLLN